MLVIEGNPGLGSILSTVGGNAGIKRQEKLGNAPIEAALFSGASGAVHDANVGVDHFQERLFVHPGNVPVIFYPGLSFMAGILKFFVVSEMKKTQMRGVEISLQSLQPVAGPLVTQRSAALWFCQSLTELRKRRWIVTVWPRVSPDDPILLQARIGDRSNPLLEFAS